LALFPDTARIVSTPTGDRLTIAGCDPVVLAEQYKTPLYLYDRATCDASVAAYRAALAAHFPGKSGITYAGKAFLCTAIAQWVGQSGLWVDCTGVGELRMAVNAGVRRGQLVVHGVNKSPVDLTAAVDLAGTLVVDNLAELERLIPLYRQPHVQFPELWLRLRPGLTVDTHSHTQTGQAESKFGMDGDEILHAARRCQEEGLPLKGIHFHLGSQFSDPAPLDSALETALDLMIAAGAEPDWTLSPGGGWAVAYHEDDLPHPEINFYVRLLAESLVTGCERRGMPLPRLQLEPGRSLIARAGVALYRVGTIKQSTHRRWVLLDGGLSDNPRPALYGARYSALPVEQPWRPADDPAWLAGPHCESGDVLIENLPLAEVQPGELVAIPVSGAYQLSMSSNYNGASRPAVLWLEDGQAFLIQSREGPGDLARRDRRLSPVNVQVEPDTPEHAGAVLVPGIRFAKFHGLGNDYLVIDSPNLADSLSPAQIRRICDRHYGVGSDGLLVGSLHDPSSDFGLRCFNPDGSEFEKSGNGLRIFSRFLWDEGLVGEKPFTIGTPGGQVTSRVHPSGRRVTVDMGVVSFDSRTIPVHGPPREVLNEILKVDGRELRYCAATIGNPHCVVLCDEISAKDARVLGPLIAGNARFPNRTNVQFMVILDRVNIQIEIWERGVGYTLASGSSSCAAAAVAYRLGLCDADVTVHMRGGELSISILTDLSVSMTGPIVKVCEGVLTPELLSGR
jgi:diaminopimelate decarboxylase/diaminopimelate epimerase